MYHVVDQEGQLGRGLLERKGGLWDECLKIFSGAMSDVLRREHEDGGVWRNLWRKITTFVTVVENKTASGRHQVEGPK